MSIERGASEGGSPVRPGARIGMLGAGQLGRMGAIAAANLGYKVVVYTDRSDSPAGRVSAQEIVGEWTNRAALEAFARSVDVITLEWENIPVEAVEFLSTFTPVYPGAQALSVCQDRAKEKRFIESCGLRPAPFVEVTGPEELEQARVELGHPCILKSATLGYDGKGQVRCEPDVSSEQAWKRMGSQRGVVEGFITFKRELSVLVARSVNGEMSTWPVVENVHRDHILWESRVPEALDAHIANQAAQIARTLAEKLDYIGVLAVELFETPDGDLIVNEMAPRPHNSGHWTIEGSMTSQFEQSIRAVCGLPLGKTRLTGHVKMQNLLGDEVLDLDPWLRTPGAHLHIYGKDEIRPGRKMGHVTVVTPFSGA